jgi:predicted metal-dependent hydrolase
LPHIDIGLRRIEYSTVRGRGRRYTYLKFGADAMLEVVLPRGKSVDVEAEIRARSQWIVGEFDRVSSLRTVLGPSHVMLGGDTLPLVQGGSDGRLLYDQEAGVVRVGVSDSRGARELVRRWFLGESSAYAVRRVGELAPLVGARPSRVDVREIDKWGYCTRGGRLSFSWQLIALPERLREYVVFHELTHLLEFNHSQAFKEKLSRVCPGFRAREKELDCIVPYDRLGPPA